MPEAKYGGYLGVTQLVEYATFNRDCEGSIPSTETTCSCSSVGRAAVSYSAGRGFDASTSSIMADWRNWQRSCFVVSGLRVRTPCRPPSIHKYADVPELAYDADLKSAAKACGFDSHHRHEIITKKGCSHRMMLIEKLKTWLKQTFCRHDWITIGEVSRFTDRDQNGCLVECLSEVRECRRCRRRENYFIRIPHG